MARLIVRESGSEAVQLELNESVTTVGRHSDNHIVLADDSVSSHHAEIVREAGGFTLRDLDSSNGTTVNGVAVTEQKLRSGDRIAFGKVEAFLEAVDVADTQMECAGSSPVAARRTRKLVLVGLGCILGLFLLHAISNHSSEGKDKGGASQTVAATPENSQSEGEGHPVPATSGAIAQINKANSNDSQKALAQPLERVKAQQPDVPAPTPRRAIPLPGASMRAIEYHDPATPPGMITVFVPPKPYPFLTVKGKRHEQVVLLAHDGPSRLILRTNSGQIECNIEDLDFNARNEFTRRIGELDKFEDLQRKEEAAKVAKAQRDQTADGKRKQLREESKVSSLLEDLLADEPLPVRSGAGGVLSLVGTWRFSNGSVRTFEGNPLAGTSLNEEGYRDLQWRGTWSRSGNGVSFELFRPEASGPPVIVEMQNPDYVVGEDTSGHRFSARRVGTIPDEYASKYTPPQSAAVVDAEMHPVDKDYLRLVRCVNNPWTSDPEQGGECGLMPREETELRLSAFNGGANPATRVLVNEILKQMAALAAAYQGRQATQADLDEQYARTRFRTTTTTEVNPGTGKVSSRTEQTGTTFGDFLGHMLNSTVAGASARRQIAYETDKLRDLYLRTAMKLAELAPATYVQPRGTEKLLSVQVIGDRICVENVSNHALTNVTVRMDIFRNPRSTARDDFRLFYSPRLRVGEKRFSSAAQMVFDDADTKILLSLPDRKAPLQGLLKSLAGSESTAPKAPAAKIQILKVSAWAREAIQNEDTIIPAQGNPLTR